jgi:nucleotide-binding universal stress UspA family protein
MAGDSTTETRQAEETGASPAVFTNVLCAVDGSPGGYAAVEQAAALTGPDGHMTLLAVTSFRSAGAARSPAIAPVRMKEILDRAVAIAESAGVHTTVEVDPAFPPAHVILEWAAEHDLLAMGAPTTPWPAGMFGGGPTAAAVGSLITPLLAARSFPSLDSVGGPIVVASDGLVGSDRLVEFATRLGHAGGSSVHLLHAAGHRSAKRRERIAEQARTLERTLGGASSVKIASGSARAIITGTARELNAHLVVMSSRRLHGPLAIGSVSRQVVHKAACSVLLVPHEHLQA